MGRQKELDLIESPRGVNIVYGGRQLGKSALLRMAQKDINFNENGDRAVLVDIKNRNYQQAARHISEAMVDEGILAPEQVTEDWDTLARSIKNRICDPEHPSPTCFCCWMRRTRSLRAACGGVQAFRLPEGDPGNRQRPVQVRGGRPAQCGAVQPGPGIAKQPRADPHGVPHRHPLPCDGGPELLEVPLFYLGYRFKQDSATDTLVSTIFGTTNYFPGLLQLYCSKLIEAVQRDYAGYNETETPPYIVSEAHIKKALADKTLATQIREKFFITLKVDEDDYYYLIALLAAYHYHICKERPGFDANDLLGYASGFGISKLLSLRQEQIVALMEEMRELNILQQLSNGQYRFTRHSFCQMMGNIDEIEDAIVAYAVKEEA